MSVPGVTFSILPPSVAIERAADVEGRCYAYQCQGEELQSVILVEPELSSPADRVATRWRQAWWMAHYWGVPSKADERDLLAIRAVITLSDTQALEFVARLIGRA